jgi:CRISPR-associated protein Cas2
MLYIISYDISNDKRRTQVAKILDGFGQRVQYSVFECDLTASQYAILQQRLNAVLHPDDGDNVRTYRLCAACITTITSIGSGPAVETSPDIYVI